MATTATTDKQLLTSSPVSGRAPLSSYRMLGSAVKLTSACLPGWVHVNGVPTRIKLIDSAGQVDLPQHLLWFPCPDLFPLSALCISAVAGGVWTSSLSVLCPRGRLHPVLQPGQPRLLPERLVQVDPADPSGEPDLSDHPGGDPVRPLPKRGHSDSPGPARRQTGGPRPGQKAFTADRSHGLPGVFCSDPTQPQRRV